MSVLLFLVLGCGERVLDYPCPAKWRDYDADGFGDPDFPLQNCDGGIGYVSNQDDCDDTDVNITTECHDSGA